MRRTSCALLALACVQMLNPASAAAQSLPVPRRPYRVAVPFTVYSRPDSGSRVVGTITPGQTIVAGRTTRHGWTEVQFPGSRRSVGFGHVTRQDPGLGLAGPGYTGGRDGYEPTPSRQTRTSARSWVGWALGVASALAIFRWFRRRASVAPEPVISADSGGPVDPRAVNTREVLAVQAKWINPQSFLGPNVVSQLDGDLRRYKLGERGAAQNARGVIVTSGTMGPAGREAAATLGIHCQEGVTAEVLAWIANMSSGKRRDQAIGQWYEEVIADWYRSAGYTVDHRGKRLGIRDGGIDLICWRR